MEAINGDNLLKVEIKHEIEDIEDYAEFVKIEAGENLVCLANAVDRSNEEFNLVTIKQEEVDIKLEENGQYFDENLQNNTSKEKQIKDPKSKKKRIRKRNVVESKTYFFKKDVKALLYKCKNCTYECNDTQLLEKHRLECNSNCESYNAEMKDQFPSFDFFLEVKKSEPEMPEKNFYQCPHCPVTYGVRDIYLQHLRRHQDLDKQDLVFCYECPFACIYKSSLTHHMKKHRKSTDFHCKYCSYCDVTNAKLKKHEELHEKSREIEVVKCQQCPFVCSSQVSLTNHMACHDATTGIRCQFCSFKTESEILLGQHRKLHTWKPFKCTKCPYEARRAGHFRRHVLTHEPKPPVHVCSQCYYKAPTKDLLQNHMEDKHNGNSIKQNMYCYHCPYYCKYKKSMINHVEKHRIKTDFQCRLCSYYATGVADLKNHKELHNPNRIIEEKKVPKSTEKPYKCQECQFACYTQKFFLKHKACHESTTGTKCQFCSFRTEYATALGRHRRMHPIKSFKCSKCSYETWKPLRFKIHSLRHEPIDVTHTLECCKCPYRTYRKFLLERHLEKKHGDKSVWLIDRQKEK